MGAARPTWLALFSFLLLFWIAVAPILGQNPVGHLEIATDYELFGTSDLRGGGHVTWTLTGAKAADLRGKILHLFDEYFVIPQGFAFGSLTTNGDRDGRLDPAEGVRYTDLVETRLEASGGGTPAQYLVTYPFDLREKNPDPAVGFQRSTSGLADTDMNSTADVAIRFLFEANNTMSNGRFPLATQALADGLYSGFSYGAVQSPTLTASFPYPAAWPFLIEGGWHVVNEPTSGRAAFWAGNNLTGEYDVNANASSATSAGSSIDPPSMPFDLRFASRARAEFNYTGRVADSGDSLRFEYANDSPAFTNWQPLSFGSGIVLPSTAPGVWSNGSVDLGALLGQKVRLRLHFTSDLVGTAPGFFIRDFALRAPATYDGEIVESDTHYLIGTLSFSEPVVTAGGIHVIRTPGGEIATYGTSWSASAVPGDTMHFRTFDVTENPQILFGVMLAASYAISRLQESAYLQYRELHPAVYRPAVPKAKWLHRSGAVAMGVLVLFYFVPTATWVIGLRVFVSGPVYWFLALTFALTLGLGTRAYYRQKLEDAPPPVVGEEPVLVRKVLVSPPPPEDRAVVAHCTHCLREIREADPTYRCTCGALYHVACATGLMRCSNCRKPIALEAARTRPPVSMRCESCGELQVVADGADPRAVTCAHCGGRLRHVDAGKRYLIVASNPAIAFTWMKDLTKAGQPALCLTSAAPDRIRLEFGANNVTIVQVSATAKDAVDPRRLDPVGLKAILPLAREAKGGVILYDSLDQIISESSMGDVVRFLRKANDMAFVHGVTVIARIAPGRLADDELKRLNAEFDEYLDLSAQL